MINNEKLFYYVVRSNDDRSYYSAIGSAKDEESALVEAERLRNLKRDKTFDNVFFVAAVPVQYDGSFNGWNPVRQAIFEKYSKNPELIKPQVDGQDVTNRYD